MSWVLNPLTGRVQQSDGGQLGPPSPYGKTPTGSAQLGPKAPYTPNANANYVFDEYFKAASSWNTAKNSAGGLLNEGQPFPDEAIWNTKIEMAKSRDDSAKYERDRQDGLDADALRRSDALAKSSGSGSSAAQKKADKLEADRKGRAGAKSGADYLESSAASGATSSAERIKELFGSLETDANTAGDEETSRIKTLFDKLDGTANELSDKEKKRITDLYDGLDESAKTQFDSNIDQLNKDLAQGADTMNAAGKSFADNFQGSTAFEGVPVQQFETGANPLIGALQAQGAGTSEVDAAIASENQGMKGTADLQKWMIGQLNTGSKNFDSSVKNASSAALAANLQDLTARGTTIKGGMTRDYTNAKNANASARSAEESDAARELRTQLSDIALGRGAQESTAATNLASVLAGIKTGRADATTDADKERQKLLDAAANIRANSLATYGAPPQIPANSSATYGAPPQIPANSSATVTPPKAKLNFAQQVAAKHPNFKGTTAQAKKKFPKLFAGK